MKLPLLEAIATSEFSLDEASKSQDFKISFTRTNKKGTKIADAVIMKNYPNKETAEAQAKAKLTKKYPSDTIAFVKAGLISAALSAAAGLATYSYLMN